MTDDEIIARIRDRILPDYADAFKAAAPDFKDRPIADIAKFFAFLYEQALAELLVCAEVRAINEASETVRMRFMAYLVSMFNAGLPVDYPFIIIVIKVKEAKELRFGMISRTRIPGMHELLSPDIIPVVSVDSLEDLKGNFTMTANWHIPDE